MIQFYWTGRRSLSVVWPLNSYFHKLVAALVLIIICCTCRWPFLFPVCPRGNLTTIFFPYTNVISGASLRGLSGLIAKRSRSCISIMNVRMCELTKSWLLLLLATYIPNLNVCCSLRVHSSSMGNAANSAGVLLIYLLYNWKSLPLLSMSVIKEIRKRKLVMYLIWMICISAEKRSKDLKDDLRFCLLCLPYVARASKHAFRLL